MCDGIAIVTLHGLGMDVSRLMSGVQKISRFNRERFGTANNESGLPDPCPTPGVCAGDDGAIR